MKVVLVRTNPALPKALWPLALLVALITVPLMQAEAQQVIGQISSVDQRPEAIEIEGELWKLSPRLEIGTQAADALTQRMDIRSLRRGQVVLFEERDGQITTLTVLPDATEVPR